MPYDLSSFVSYNKLSSTHKAFSLSVSSTFEPEYYHQVVQYVHWREAIEAKFKLLSLIIYGLLLIYLPINLLLDVSECIKLNIKLMVNREV